MLSNLQIIETFYKDCLTVNSSHDSSKILNEILADDFQSINAHEVETKTMLIEQVKFFWDLIPDLKWEPQEIIEAGNRVIVRSVATGSPQGEFFGLKLDGSKSFNIMSIDIHTIENGKIVTAYHQEEWLTALKQLSN